MTLSSDHSVKFVSVKDFLVEADLLLQKSLLCLERGTTGYSAKGGAAITSCYLFVIWWFKFAPEKGSSALSPPVVSGPALQVSPAGGGCGDGESVAQGLLFEEGKRSLWYLSFCEPACAHCFEYFGLEGGEHLTPWLEAEGCCSVRSLIQGLLEVKTCLSKAVALGGLRGWGLVCGANTRSLSLPFLHSSTSSGLSPCAARTRSDFIPWSVPAMWASRSYPLCLLFVLFGVLLTFTRCTYLLQVLIVW